jgi:acyl-coenzyme A thioesterase PaaI-like protein
VISLAVCCLAKFGKSLTGHPFIVHNTGASVLPKELTKDVTKELPKDLVKLRPSIDEYDRIDYKLLSTEYKIWVKDHALHETLAGDGKIEAYEVYKRKNADEVVCLVRFGKSLNGHPGIVHGGITSLVFDNTFGWLFISLKYPSAVTANLNINYRNPIFAETSAILTARMIRRDGRKLYMEAKLCDTKGKLLAESTTLFITIKQNFKTSIYKLVQSLKSFFSSAELKK